MPAIASLTRLVPSRWRPRPTVGIVRLAGAIGMPLPLRGDSLSIASLAGALDRAFALKNLQAVALAINSPGGAAVQSALIARRIRALAVEKKVPVLAFVEDVAASGGYWLATAADEIYADECSIVGSIGVIAAGFGFPELLQRLGIERRVHTAGPRKAMLDPFRQERPEDVARLMELQQEIHEGFKAQVRERRAGKLKGDEAELFSGDIWTGRPALARGLIDGIGDLRGILRGRYGEKVKLVTVGAPRGWLRRRLGLARPESWADQLAASVEERALWGRYGL